MRGGGGCVPAIPSGPGSGVGELSFFPNMENRLPVCQRRGASQQSVNTNSPREFTCVLTAPKLVGTVIQHPSAVPVSPPQIPVLWSITPLPSGLLLGGEGGDRITDGRGWKGPLWVSQSNPPAKAGSPRAGCTGQLDGKSRVQPWCIFGDLG